MSIRLLSDSIIGKIAAGEVVERPAAAIKEMVENSLDAGATAITVEVRDAGTSYMRVSDNGCGIEDSDLLLAFERHATSKIRNEEDLQAIATLGFRGEALASIAAVSKVTMTTRTAGRETGVKVINEGGKTTSIQETACAKGTSLVVRDLFYNTPVRLQFLKKQAVELNTISDLMAKMILSRPDVSFRLISDGKTLYQSPGDCRQETALLSVYGRRAFNQMRPVEGHAGGIVVHGYVGIGELARGNRNQELFFINQRVMISQVLSQAVENACRERVMIGKFPVCVLQITIPYEAVDVNVHPNKLEVRFRDETMISEALFTLVFEALRDRDAFEHPVPLHLSGQENASGDAGRAEQTEKDQDRTGPEKTSLLQQLQSRQNAEVTVSSCVPAPVSAPATKPEPVWKELERDLKEAQEPECGMKEQISQTFRSEQLQPAAETLPKPDFSKRLSDLDERAEQVNTIMETVHHPIRVFGALFDTYILIEYEEHLLLVDQHAVHERLLFDRMMKTYENSHMGQEMLIPIVISVTRREQQLLEENREALESIGLVIEPFGETDAAIRTMPVILGETQAHAFVREVIDELENQREPSFEKRRRDLLQSACKHAVKGGEKLSEDQLQSLVEEMIDKHVTPTCPHGRPLVVSLSRRELDKKFKRIQN